MQNISTVSLLLCTLALGSCQSMSEGVISLEARANVLNDAEIQDGPSDGESIDAESYGVHAALMTPIIDLLGGLDQKTFGSEDNPELMLGVRRRFFEIWRLHPFLEGNVRYGTGLDNGVDDEDYFGWQAGGGVLLDLTDHLFLSARVMYETTELEQSGGDTVGADGLIGTIGLGFAF
jgi:hypothetical protein